MLKLPLTLLFLCIIGSAISTICRDGSVCPATTSCCPTKDAMGCCPFTKGVCCKDQAHCCPENTVCLDDGKGCTTTQEVDNMTPFLAYLESKDLFEPQILLNQIKALPLTSWTDLLVCIGDLKPVAVDLVKLVSAIKLQSWSLAAEELGILLIDGNKMVLDCWKLIPK